MDELLTSKQAGAVLGVTRGRVQALVRLGQLQPIYTPDLHGRRQVAFSSAAVLALRERRQRDGAKPGRPRKKANMAVVG